jgi:hypothetical protein
LAACGRRNDSRLQVVTYFNPVRYYIEVLRAVLLKGASFGLQQGAAMIARSEEIHEILLEPGSTTTEYVLGQGGLLIGTAYRQTPPK